MDDSKNNPFSNLQWKQFEQFFGGRFPLPDDWKTKDLSWIEQYVQDALNQSTPQTSNSSNLSAIRSESFETVSHVIVKIPIRDKEQAKNIRVLAGVHNIRLEDTDGAKNILPLPAYVIPESCKAVYKDGILQLYIRKQKISDHFHEVNIRFLT